MKPEPAKEIVNRVFQEIQEKKNREGHIGAIWKKVAGKNVSRHTSPASFKGGALVVNVDRSSWLYELNLCKPILIRRLKKKMAVYSTLKELKFRIGAI